MTYMDFLRSKIVTAPETGFTVSDSDINPALKPHQRDAVKWAVAGGRRGLFERFGLGKTVQELEYCRIVTEHEGGKALIVLPLGVRQEFTHDAVQLLGMEPPRRQPDDGYLHPGSMDDEWLRRVREHQARKGAQKDNGEEDDNG